jgi:hypothetical protein
MWNMRIRMFVGLYCVLPVIALAAAIDVPLVASPLIGHPSKPFSLEFELDDGSSFFFGPSVHSPVSKAPLGKGDGNNLVTLSNFQFTGGGALGSPNVSGGVSGSIASLSRFWIAAVWRPAPQLPDEESHLSKRRMQ